MSSAGGNGFDARLGAASAIAFRKATQHWAAAGSGSVIVGSSADDIEPGDLLASGTQGKLVRSTKRYQVTFVGVFSADPGFIGGKPFESNTTGTVPVAVVGIVPVKACTENGSIAAGDRLVSSSVPGHAMRGGDQAPHGTVIGEALEPLTNERGIIWMLVMLQ